MQNLEILNPIHVTAILMCLLPIVFYVAMVAMVALRNKAAIESFKKEFPTEIQLTQKKVLEEGIEERLIILKHRLDLEKAGYLESLKRETLELRDADGCPFVRVEDTVSEYKESVPEVSPKYYYVNYAFRGEEVDCGFGIAQCDKGFFDITWIQKDISDTFSYGNWMKVKITFAKELTSEEYYTAMDEYNNEKQNIN